MLLAIGTKVRLRHTGELGMVTALLDGSMVQVYLERDGIEIPAFIDDLIAAEDWKPKPKVPESSKPMPESQYSILRSYGIQLAFLPENVEEGAPDYYRIFLINDTQIPAIYSLTFSLKGRMIRKWHGKLDPVSLEQTGELLYDQLNDSPAFHLECRPVKTTGTGNLLEKTIRIKPKQFFKNTRTAPLLNTLVHWYRVFPKLDQEKLSSEEDLKTYTERNVVPHQVRSGRFGPKDLYDVAAKASFPTEIDLHIERLRPNATGLSNAAILRIQLEEFDRFLEKSIELGLDRVFVIHGIGKGRLRNEIASRLLQHPEVETFINEYHPRYGFGATEVVF